MVSEARRPTPTPPRAAALADQMVTPLAPTADVANASNLPGWEGSFPLGSRLSEALGAPVRVGNDVDVATNAEFVLGAGRPYRSLLGVFWGTGVGGGLVLGGKRWLGRGAAGEIGHMVVKLGGARCPCGRRGCVEAYAGRKAMELRARLTSSIWERALRHDDALAIELLDRAVEALGAGIASAVNLIDVEAVVVGGGLGVRLGEPYLERIRKRMSKHLFVADNPPPVELVALGDLGGAIGASLLFTDKGVPAAAT